MGSEVTLNVARSVETDARRGECDVCGAMQATFIHTGYLIVWTHRRIADEVARFVYFCRAALTCAAAIAGSQWRLAVTETLRLV